MVYMAIEGVREGNELVKKILSYNQENGKPMTKYRISSYLNVRPQAVYKWVRGQASPTRENFNKLVRYEQFLKLINRNRPF